MLSEKVKLAICEVLGLEYRESDCLADNVRMELMGDETDLVGEIEDDSDDQEIISNVVEGLQRKFAGTSWTPESLCFTKKDQIFACKDQ